MLLITELYSYDLPSIIFLIKKKFHKKDIIDIIIYKIILDKNFKTPEKLNNKILATPLNNKKIRRVLIFNK